MIVKLQDCILQRQGPMRKWSEGGKLIEEEFYDNGRLSGIRRKWDHNGNLCLEIQYHDGLPNGVSRIWFSNGRLQYEEQFVEGFRSDIQREWYLDGQLKCVAKYDHGQLHGLKNCYHRNGGLKSEETYMRSVLNGISRKWDANGRIRKRSSYINNRLHGEQIEWDETGREVSRSFYANGVRIPKKYEVLILNNELHAKHILRIRNVEVRRVCLEALGYEKFLTQLPHEVIHRDNDQELVRMRWHKQEEEVFLVKVKCPSTGAFYTLRVPPYVQNIKQAIAWTFGLKENEYHPDKET